MAHAIFVKRLETKKWSGCQHLSDLHLKQFGINLVGICSYLCEKLWVSTPTNIIFLPASMATAFSFVCEFSERIAHRESDGTTTAYAKMMKPVRADMIKNMTNR
ncbi:hypothetical protein GBA52_024433 [Prunus armeniaca]|nr:hypothetical protein GBA52_024433 [Prunus armeniaca]